MLGNWCRETTTTTGTGNLTIAEATGWPRISEVVGVGPWFYYAILLDSDATPIEAGIGYLSAADTMVRTKVLATFSSGTYDDTSPSAISLASGTKRVIVTPLSHSIQTPLPFVSGASPFNNKSISNGAAYNYNLDSTNGYGDSDQSGRLNVWPWLHNYGGEVDAFKIQVSTAESGKIMRVGLYAVASGGLPGALIVEGSASIDVSTTGIKTDTFTARVIPPGWYYIALLGTTTGTCKLCGSGAGVANTTFTTTAPWGMVDSQVGFGGYALSVATTAMPATCPALSVTTNLHIPQIMMRCV